MRAATFGPLVVETDVDEAVIATLRLWLPTYLAQLERDRSLANRFLARPKANSYANTLDDEEFLDHILPAIIVTTASTQGDPITNGDGVYYAAWRVVVSAVTRGRRPAETRRIAALYGGAVRQILVQQQELDGLAGETRWTAGNVAPVTDTTGAGRYLAAAINQFTVYVDEVVDAHGGPILPSPPESPYENPDPVGSPDAVYEPWVTVGKVDAQITVKQDS